MTPEPLILTLDIGTSSVRVLLWDALGQERDTVHAQTPYRMHTTQDGGVELPAQELLSLVASCLDQALAQAGRQADAIRAVGITTFWHSLLGLDAGGIPVTPVYSWADNRAAAAARQLRVELDEAAIHARTGCRLHPSYYPAKLRWLRDSESELFRKIAHWVSPSEYLFGELFGPEARRVSVSMASGTGLLNHARCAWDEETLALLSLSPELFSPLTDMNACPQGLRPEYASRWPALRQTPFLPAVGDGACGNVGSGCLTPERFAINLGTSGAIRALWTEERSNHGEHGEKQKEETIENRKSKIENPTPYALHPTPFQGLWRYRVDARRPMMGAAFSDGGHVLAYFKRALQLPDDEELAAQLAAMAPGSHGLTFLPYLAGERSLGWHPDARAALMGMNLDTTPVEIVRAALEGVALQFVEAAEQLRLAFPQQREIVASGGAFTHLPLWGQILADALDQPVTLTAEAEATSRGAALLALEAVGLLTSAQDAPPRMGQTFLPDSAHHTVYQELLGRQQEAYTWINR